MNKYIAYLEKQAAEAKKEADKQGPEVGEHQLRVLQKLKAKPDGEGLVVAHGMGSGKTLTGLLAAKHYHDEDPEAHVVAITPASLVKNFHQEEEKHGTGIDKKRFTTVSVDALVNKVDEIAARKPKLIIVDEAHKVRNTDTARYAALKKLHKETGAKLLLLSGTPDYNKPADMRVIVNLAARDKALPPTEKEFDDKFIGTRKVKPGFMGRLMGVEDGEVKYVKNTGELKQTLSKYVDIYDGKSDKSEHFPSSHEEEVKVTMSKRQHDLYRFLENDLPAPIRWKIRLGLPLNKKESASLNSFSTGIRQVSNSTKPYEREGVRAQSPKIEQIVKDHVEHRENDPNFRGIIYSNYLEAGLKPLSDHLNEAGVDHAIYDGSLTTKEKNALIEKYNNGELKTLLVSSSGAEGLNLKGTKMVQTMEPHFNRKKIDQVVARGIRFKSHEHLPEEERHVIVKHYRSVLPKGMWDNITGRHVHSIDEYLDRISSDKADLGEQMKKLIANDPGHYKAASEQGSWQSPPPISQSVLDKLTNPARYVGQIQSHALPGAKGQILAKVEKILITQPFRGDTDVIGKHS